MTVAREGLPFIVVPIVVAVALFVFGRGPVPFVFACIFALAALFCLFFFRDPYVAVTQGEGLILSPCNGTVMDVVECENERVVRVFLSIFNVHLQRSPVAGICSGVEHRKGRFLAAWNPEAFLQNEQNVITITSGDSVFVVRQVAGFLARRCVAWVKEGDVLERGQKIGLIKFSSQVDLHLPKNIEVLVKKGDKVVAGKTVFGVNQ